MIRLTIIHLTALALLIHALWGCELCHHDAEATALSHDDHDASQADDLVKCDGRCITIAAKRVSPPVPEAHRPPAWWVQPSVVRATSAVVSLPTQFHNRSGPLPPLLQSSNPQAALGVWLI